MKWDMEADVIVAGYGLAGAITAIEAHDAGAKVVILEKGEYPGGCSIYGAGMIICAADEESAVDYLTLTSGGRTEDDLVRVFAREMTLNEGYVRKLAEANNSKVVKVGGPEKRDDIAYIRSHYPFKGGDTFYNVRIAEVPGFEDFPWLQRSEPAGPNLMKVAFDNVAARNIEVLTSAPARRLVVDGDRKITGVIAEIGGEQKAIRTSRAVVLACGGFEQNEWMRMQFLQGKPFVSMAPLTHTGDGIVMAQEVGAALWHMWHVHGSYGFKFPEFPIAFRHVFTGRRNVKRAMPWIVVDKFGRRYMNEYPPAPQDTGHRPMELFDPDELTFPRIPSYLVFDEAGKKRGPIAVPLSIGHHVYQWSKDNEAEVAKGWIMRAGSIGELAEKIKGRIENEGRMDAGMLEATAQRWNEIVKSGVDALHRPPGTMMPLETPPFYAVPVWPMITNTQGGPRHNARQQVLNAFGEAIPRLYAAGELGSFWGHLYLLGGNLSECLTSGRVAGRNAAADLG